MRLRNAMYYYYYYYVDDDDDDDDTPSRHNAPPSQKKLSGSENIVRTKPSDTTRRRIDFNINNIWDTTPGRINSVAMGVGH